MAPAWHCGNLVAWILLIEAYTKANELTPSRFNELAFKQYVDARVEFFTKEWDDGKTERMVRFKVIDASDPDGGEKELEAGVRRAKPLNDLQLELRQRGIDIASRLVKIDCYAEKHPTKPGRTIGRWRCVDTGPAPAALLGNGIPF